MESQYSTSTNNNVAKSRYQQEHSPYGHDRFVISTGGPFSSNDIIQPIGSPRDACPAIALDTISTDKAPNDEQTITEPDSSHWSRIKNQNRLDSLCVVGFCLALIGFVAAFHIQVVPKIPYPLAGNIQDIDPSLVVLDLWREGVNLIPVVWGLKYIRKIGFVLLNFVCLMSYSKQETNPLPRVRTSGRPIPSPTPWPYYILPVVLYHGGFGTWVGMATNLHLPYQTSDVEWVVVGLVIFLIGELLIIVKAILNIRQSNRGRIQVEPLLGTIEVGEVLSSIGFACFTLTFPACVMAAVRVIIAVPAFMGYVHGKPF